MVMQVFANMLIEHNVQGGSIVNIASIIGKYGNIGQANYAASKAGVALLTKTACKEFGKFGIRCNSVLPGYIRTPMTATVPEKVVQKVLPQIPMNRFGETSGTGLQNKLNMHFIKKKIFKFFLKNFYFYILLFL